MESEPEEGERGMRQGKQSEVREGEKCMVLAGRY